MKQSVVRGLALVFAMLVFSGSAAARWLTPDPLVLQDPTICLKSPLDCNLYSYAHNNPTNVTDPSGLLPPDGAPTDNYANSVMRMSVGQRTELAATGAGATALGAGIGVAGAYGPSIIARVSTAAGATAGWFQDRLQRAGDAIQQWGRGFAERFNGAPAPTVWNSIKATQPAYEGTVIPRSFELATGNGTIWVHGNATKHMAEFAKTMLERGVGRDLVNLASQQQMTSLRAAVEAATANGVRYNELMTSAGWELKFAAARVEGQLPVLIHALSK